VTWGGLHDFLAMGGYAKYVWGSYGVTALAIFIELVLLVRRHRAAKGRARGLE
jgi:heme exporter protein D